MEKKLSEKEACRKASKFINNFNKSFFYHDNFKEDKDVLEFKKCFYEAERLCNSNASTEKSDDEIMLKACELFELQIKIKHKIDLFKTLNNSLKTLKNRVPSRFGSERTGYGHEQLGSIKSISKNAKNKK